MYLDGNKFSHLDRTALTHPPLFLKSLFFRIPVVRISNCAQENCETWSCHIILQCFCTPSTMKNIAQRTQCWWSTSLRELWQTWMELSFWVVRITGAGGVSLYVKFVNLIFSFWRLLVSRTYLPCQIKTWSYSTLPHDHMTQTIFWKCYRKSSPFGISVCTDEWCNYIHKHYNDR